MFPLHYIVRASAYNTGDDRLILLLVMSSVSSVEWRGRKIAVNCSRLMGYISAERDINGDFIASIRRNICTRHLSSTEDVSCQVNGHIICRLVKIISD